LAAPAASEDGKARRDQIAVLSAGPGRIEGRVLQQPHLFGRCPAIDRLDACLHALDSLRVKDGIFVNRPVNRAGSVFH